MSRNYAPSSQLATIIIFFTFYNLTCFAQQDSSSSRESIPVLQENLENNRQQQTPNYNHQTQNPKTNIPQAKPSTRDTSIRKSVMAPYKDSISESNKSSLIDSASQKKIEQLVGSDKRLGKDAQGRELYQDEDARIYFVDDAGNKVYIPNK